MGLNLGPSVTDSERSRMNRKKIRSGHELVPLKPRNSKIFLKMDSET